MYSLGFPLSQLQKALLAISLLAALFFFLLLPWRPYPGSILLKWLPVGILVFFVLQSPLKKQILLFAIAVFCHSIGDLLLEIDRVFCLRPAMLAFGLGHIGYSMVFLQDRLQPISIPPKRKPFLVGILLFVTGMLVFLLAQIPPHWITPVTLYLVVITSMAISTVLAGYSGTTIIFGALLYIFSDSLISLDTFIHKLPIAHYLIYPSYYAAQLLIILGFVREKFQGQDRQV